MRFGIPFFQIVELLRVENLLLYINYKQYAHKRTCTCLEVDLAGTVDKESALGMIDQVSVLGWGRAKTLKEEVEACLLGIDHKGDVMLTC